MARIEGVSDAKAGLLTRSVFGAAKRMRGMVAEPLRIMALNGWVMGAAGGFETAIARAKTVDERLKGLASVKVSALIGCVF